MLLERVFRRRRQAALALVLAASTIGTVGCDDDKVTAPTNATYLITVSPKTSDLAVGATQQLTAAPVDFYGNPVTGQAITWESSIPSIATVSATGLVTMLTAGSTTIVARSGGAYGTAVVSSPTAVASVAIASIPTTLAIPLTLQLNAQALDANGGQLLPAGGITYSSSAPTIATVSATGLVTAVSAGSAVITATSQGKSASVTVNTIVFTPVASVALSPYVQTVAVGATQQFTATIKDAPGNNLTGKPVVWASSAPAVATVSQTGLVTMLTAGTAIISATSETKIGYGAVTNSPTANVLQNNVGVPAAGAPNTSTVYLFLVPPGATAATVTLIAGTGDPDIFIYKPGVTVDASGNGAGNTCVSGNNPGVTETCVISAANIATPGLWQFQVFGYPPTAYAGWTARATVTAPGS